MLIIVGLGNPGAKYEKTYHNMGFTVIDKLAKKVGISFRKNTCDAIVGECFLRGEKIILAKPLTFMNNSGVSVKQLMGSYKAKSEEIVVVYDDVDLDRGALRIREKGSAGTHNGMRSIVSSVGENFPRVRVGIGKSDEIPLVDYVLSKVSGEAKEVLEESTDRAADALYYYVQERNLEKVGARYNGKGK